MTEATEAPFRPREKLVEKQKYFQSIRNHTHLKGPYDRITSVAIPLALTAASLFMIVSSIVISILFLHILLFTLSASS
jgi:hypothetical protein